MNRRDWLIQVGCAASAAVWPFLGASAKPSILTSTIKSTQEPIPKVGMGTWITFDVSRQNEIAVRREVLSTFFELGGRMVDSSPMYGSAERVIGQCLQSLDHSTLYSAGKIWIPGAERGIHQVNYSRDLWGIDRFDLMQVHNMVDWRTHLETLAEWKSAGQLRHIGLTTSHGRRHPDMLDAMAKHQLDFIQLTYNIHDREAEQRLLPMALERGVSVIANRPFKTGALFAMVGRQPLPAVAAAVGATNWAHFFLKFVVSHPAITCAIPATSKVAHMRQNMAACHGPLPDAAQRAEMAAAFSNAI